MGRKGSYMSKTDHHDSVHRKRALYQLHCHIKGRVQGVGFRYFVMDEAESRSLSGWVRNSENGEVETVLCGEKSSIETILPVLHQGPPLARVIRIDFEWEEPDPDLKGFEIRS